MPTVSDLFKSRWASGHHVGAAKPGLRAEIQTGRFDRAFGSWDDGAYPITATIATTDPATPWQATWNPSSAWIALPNVLDCERSKSFTDTNGLETCTLNVENILYTAQAGGWHKVERGYLAPLRGYTAAGRDPLLDYDLSAVSENEWFQKLGRKILLRVWEAYGDQEVAVFTGMTDGIDYTSRPDRITITARAAKWLTEEEFFGWNKDTNTGREPVTFIDRDDATNAKQVGYSASNSDNDGTNVASNVLDSDGGTYWGSDHHSVDDITEWVEIRVPQGSYDSIVLDPTSSGSDIYVSVFAKKWTDDDGNLNLPTEDGVPIEEGWVGDQDLLPTVELSWTGSSAITDFSTTEIDLPTVEPGNVIDVRVLFYITHTFDSDLTMTLESPGGTIVNLVTAEGGSGNNFGTGTTDAEMTELSDGGATTISAGTPPFVGVYKPEGNLSDFRGDNITGTWKFKVLDDATGDTGTVHAVKLYITPSAASDPVPGANGGIPYLLELPAVGHGKQTLDLGHTFVMGKGSIIRLSQRHYAQYGSFYQARINTLEAVKRTLVAGHAATLWVLVDDISDVVRVILRWAGFKEWEVESTGTKLSKRIHKGKGDSYMDVINLMADAVGYEFFVADPTPGNDDSLGVPIFRKSLVVADNIAPKISVKDTDLLTEIKVNQDDEKLKYIIRVRGRADKSGATLGADSTRRVQYTYRPPWSGAPSAGVIRHAVYFNHLFKTVDQCKAAAYYIALQEALGSYLATIVIPGYPGVDLDDFVELQDLGTGLTTRLWISERQSKFANTPPQDTRFQDGSDLMYATTFSGALVDVPDVQDIVTAINAL